MAGGRRWRERHQADAIRRLAAGSGAPLWIRDVAAGRELWASPACQALRGPDGDWTARIHDGDRERVLRALDRLAAGEAFHEEYRIGGRRLRDRGFPLGSGAKSVALAYGLVEEADERESAARQNEVSLSALLEAAPQAVVACGGDGCIRLVNAATESMFGYAREEMLGQPLEMLLPETSRAAHERHRVAYLAHPRTRPMGAGLSLAGRRKGGDEFPVEVSLSSMGEGALRLAVALVADVTARTRFEARRRESARLESLGVLAGGVAHDFNNILTGILGNASMALDTVGQRDPLRSLLEPVMEGAERAADLTRQMLAYSGKGRYLALPLDLSAVAREALEAARASIPRAVRVELDLAGGLAPVAADAAQIRQAIANLLHNAAEAIGEQAGTVTLRTRAAGRIAGLPPLDYVELEVRDTGCGMDEAVRARMFDPFFSTKFPGRGLGLAATKGIVDGHRGAIRVESAPGEGTAIRLLLPAFSPAAPGRPRVLVVDADPAGRAMAVQTLGRAGYAVDTADNDEAVRRLLASGASGFLLALLDMDLPEPGALEILRRIRQTDAATPVILSSMHAADEAAARFWGENIAGFLHKPYDAARLVRLAALTRSPVRPLPPGPAPGSPAPGSGTSAPSC
jgi:PAS domain S-box-containing protein